MLGKLAKWLRFLGFNTAYNTELSKSQIISMSIKEKRTFLTKDSSINDYSGNFKFYFVKSMELDSQLNEIIQEFDLRRNMNPFSLCSTCNSTVELISKEEIENKLPDKVRQYQDEFWYCRNCDKLYWKGSHYERMMKFLKEKNIIK